MTMFTTFSGYFPKKEMTFFTDLIGDSSPFSVIKSTNTTALIGNNNSVEGRGSILGILTVTPPSSASATYNWGGVYLSNGATAATVNRTYRLGNGEAYMEANVRMNAGDLDGDLHTTVGFGIGHNDATAGLAQSFVGFHCISGQTIKAVIVQNYVTVVSFDTKLMGTPSDNFRVYGVRVNENATGVTWTIDGKNVYSAKYAIDKGVAGMVPHVEIRDRNPSGSGSSNQSVDVDWIMFQQRVNR